MIVQVLLLALEQLSEKAVFNIVMFGTSFKELFPAPQRKSKLTAEKANKFIQVCGIFVHLLIIWPLLSYN